jgi:hypothetical protein
MDCTGFMEIKMMMMMMMMMKPHYHDKVGIASVGILHGHHRENLNSLHPK